MNLKNKLFLTLIAIFFAICIFNTNCFASDITTETITIDEWNYTFEFSNPNNYYYFIVFYKNSDSSYYNMDYIISTEPLTYTGLSSNYYHFSTTGVSTGSMGWGTKYISEISSKLNSIFSKSIDTTSQTPDTSSRRGNDFVTYKVNYEIKDTSGNVVFQGAPIVEEQKTILTPIVEKQEMKPLEQILRILPIVMIVVVSYLALRKALKMLSTFLHNS